MKIVQPILVLTLGLAVAGMSVSAQAQTIQKSQTFDSEISAQGSGWWEGGSRDMGQNFGFSNTDTNQVGAGEAGGIIVRNLARSSYYDTWANRLTLADRITAKGRIVFAYTPGLNVGVVIGHGLSLNTGQEGDKNFMGLLTANLGRLNATLVFADGSRTSVRFAGPGTSVPGVTPGQVYEWGYVYDPAGGTEGSGELVVTVTNLATSEVLTGVRSLTAAQRAIGASFDSFGMASTSLAADPALYSETYVDNVEYTASAGVPCVVVGPLDASYQPFFQAYQHQQGKVISVTVPIQYSLTNEVRLSIWSSNPAIAVVEGADSAGAATLVFPAGSGNVHHVPVEMRAAGETTFSFAVSNLCLFTNSMAVKVLPAPDYPPPHVTVTKTESFDTAESAGTNGWVELLTRSYGHDFGWGDTNIAGGVPGEAGGLIKRDDTRVSYADTTVGKLTLSDAFSAKGRVVITETQNEEALLAVGYTDSTKVGEVTSDANGIGFTTSSLPLPAGYKTYLHLSDNTMRESTVVYPAALGQVYHWEFSYDPTGGAENFGLLTVKFRAEGTNFTQTTSYSLTKADRDMGAEFDAFGFTSRFSQRRDFFSRVYADDVEYAVRPPLAIASISLVETNVVLVLETLHTNRTHVILESGQLPASAWTPVANVTMTLTNDLLVAEFPRPTASRFYRAMFE